ncbi:hypothetical protein ACES2L_08635 [Bdellovibrio bacteriovorus]
MRFALIVTAALIFFLNSPAKAQQDELIDRTFSGVSKQATPQGAKKDIQDQASQKVSEDIIKELIGEERFAKNKSLIQSRVIRNSQRYIPFAKTSPIDQEGEEFKMSVSLKVSLRDLKQLLQDSALLNENDAIPVVLPVITWSDKVKGNSYRWWIPSDKSQEQAFLVKEARLVEDALRGAFQKNNFYLVKPIEAGLVASVPSDFHSEKVAGEDAQFFAQMFNAPLLIDGQISLHKGEKANNYRIEIRMTALQVSNNRAIADVSRRYETEAGTQEAAIDRKLREVAETTANDLSSQVLEAWQRGSLNTSVIRMKITGHSTLPQTEILKEKIRSQITQVKNIRERLISSDSVSFELDASIPAAELLTKIEALDVNGKKLSKVSEGRDEIVLKWAP